MPAEMMMIVGSLMVGVAICGLILTPIVRRFMDRWERREANRWYNKSQRP